MAEPLTSPEEILIARASKETIERIQRDRKKVRAQVKPLLKKIEKHLLDDELTIEALLRWCEVGDKNVSTLFAHDLGQRPWDYITARRMEVADRLLADTNLKIWEIASIIGYTNSQSFSRAFKRLRGCSPRNYRRQAQSNRDPEPEPMIPPASPTGPLAAGIRRAESVIAAERIDLEESVRKLAENLAPEEAHELLLKVQAFGHRMQEAWTEVSFFVGTMERLFEKEYRKQGLLDPDDPDSEPHSPG